MTPADFKDWRKAMGFTQTGAAEALDMSVQMIKLYEAGVKPNGQPVVIPRTVALSCRALFHKLAPWGEQE